MNDKGMPPPPPGCVSAGSIGDKPINALDDFPTNADVVEVCCVLTGDWPGVDRETKKRMPDLGAHYARCLYEMVSRYAPRNIQWRFTCFTDRVGPIGVPTKPIPTGLYSYFSKLYLFSADAFPVNSRVLFFDLDTCIVKDWSPLAAVQIDKLVMLRDFWNNTMPCSGVMSWRAGPEIARIWNEFEPVSKNRPPYRHVRAELKKAKEMPPAYQDHRWGRNRHAPSHPPPVISQSETHKVTPNIDARTDEHWIHYYVMPDQFRYWQDELPLAFLSYKYHLLRLMKCNGETFPPLTPKQSMGALVVYFHGRPRPHEVVAKWNPFWRGVLDGSVASVESREGL